MTPEEKQRLKEYQRNYREAKKTTTSKIVDIFFQHVNGIKNTMQW